MRLFEASSYRTGAAIACVFAAPALAQSERAGRVFVDFQHQHAASSGTAVYVLGDRPELGGGDITAAPRMVQGPIGTWTLPVALPEGEPYSYAYWLRTTSHSSLGNESNGTQISSTIDTNAPVANDPFPEPIAKRAFVQTIGSDPVLYWRPVGTSTLLQQPMDLLELLPSGEKRYVAHSWGEAGERFEMFVLGSDFRVPRFGAVQTESDAFALTNTQLRPDLPPADAPEADFVRERFAVASVNVPATLNDGQTIGRGVEVLLPWNYAANTEKRYPVLYMHDGQNVFKPGGLFGTWAVEDASRKSLVEGLMREIIVVGIDNSQFRSAEYVPNFPDPAVDNDDYNRFIVEELKPLIDARYRTLPGRETTGVAGSSFGGVASLSIATQYPQVFGRVGAFSTSFWTNTIYQSMLNGDLTGARLYLDAGTDNDGLDRNQIVRDALLHQHGYALGGDLYFQIGIGQAHNEAAWSSRVDECLSFLFPAEEGSRVLYALAPDPEWDRDGDGDYNAEDLYLHEAGPSDADLDGDIDAEDADTIKAWLRR